MWEYLIITKYKITVSLKNKKEDLDSDYEE